VTEDDHARPAEVDERRVAAEVPMSRALDEREELRRRALTAFLDERRSEGYRIETRTDTHAIIGPPDRRRSLRHLLRKPNSLARQVVSVDRDGDVSVRPAEPRRS